MADPKIAKAFADPKLAPITKRIMKNPSLLSNPLENFKVEMAADPELAALAQELLPKLGKLLELEPTTPPQSKSKSPKSPTTTPDFSLVIKRAMADPKIAKAFADPKLAPITKRIMKNPSLLSNPLENFKGEMAADPELAALAQELLPKLGKLLEPRTLKESSPYKSPVSSPSVSHSPTNSISGSDSRVMYKNQADLPRLPLPSVEDTLEVRNARNKRAT